MASKRDPAADLRQIAFLLERSHQPSFRVKAFRNAASVVDDLGADEVAKRVAAGTIAELKGIGKSTAAVIVSSVNGEVPDYLAKEEAVEQPSLDGAAGELRRALRGDCHAHSNWSDGGSPIREMADAARVIGHDYFVLTDHSPSLTVANGLSPQRLEQQLDEIAELNAGYADDAASGSARPFRILTGIEVNINDDGTLDQQPDLLARLDLVVASVHGKLRMPSDEMTPRMVAAIANPDTDVLGHCTGRLVTGERGTRPESDFDAEIVFAACEAFGVAVEINSRPERLDPPKRLLRVAVETGCLFTIDTDAHAPGQLDWQGNGCERAVECDVATDSIVNTWSADDLLAWTSDHEHRPTR